MRHLPVLGVVGLILGIAGGMLGGPIWLVAGSLLFGLALLAAYGYVLFESEHTETMAPYDIGEPPPEIAPAQAEEELRRKDRGTVQQRGKGAF